MTEVKNAVNRTILLFSIFFISVSLFVYQVTLTRLYSAVLSYHYVFLTTSFAIFGLGIGSIIAYRQRSKNAKALYDVKEQLVLGSIILAVSYIVVFAINYILPFMNNLFVYVFLGTVPFLTGGYLFSIIFTEHSGISGKLYFADLIGSGAGSVAVIFLLDNAGLLKTVIIISVISLIPAVIVPSANKRIKAAGLILPVIFAVALLMPGNYAGNIEKNFNGILKNPGKTFGELNKASMLPELVFSKWNAFSRTDVIKINKNPDEMVLTIDGSANAPMYKFDGDIKSLDKFKVDTGFLPFTLGENPKTLLIGAGGGRDVLYALAGGSRDITAVEINTASIDAVKAFGEYNGNIYERPEVKVYGEDGRSFVGRSRDKYDLIFLSLVMTSTSQGMGYALSENYIYTVEAMEDYLDHLNDNGIIAFSAHSQEDLSKIAATAIQALGHKGISANEAPDYIAVFTKYMQQQHGGSHVHNPVIIIKNKPFSEKESRQLLATAQKSGNVPMYTPRVYEQGVLHHLKEAHISMKDYLRGFSTNVTPATDNNPYFYNFGKGMPAALILILLFVVIGGIVLFAPFALKSGNFKPTMYFGLLGAGFMMIEVPLIQKFILYLGHPTLAFTYVLAALLVGTGIGGYLSNLGLFNKMVKAFYLPPALVAIINIIIMLSMGFIFQNTSELSLTGRIAVASVIVMLQGFFMGMPFPRGLKLVGESGRSDTVPMMWGVNGIMSVFGSALSIVLSIAFGFTGAMFAGAVIYLIVSFFKTL